MTSSEIDQLFPSPVSTPAFLTHVLSLAPTIHAAVLCVLAVSWFWPLITAMFRRLPKSEPDVEWVSLWKCPECGTYNRRATPVCSHCNYHLESSFLTRWIPLRLSEWFKRSAAQLLWLYQALGWVLFYGLTGFAFVQLRLYTFQQKPYVDVLACTVMVVLLGALMFFRLALRPRMKSPISALMDIVAGLATTGLLLWVVYLWAAATSQKALMGPLHALYVLSLGRLRLP